MSKILLVGGSDAQRAALSDALEAAGHHVSAALVRRFTNRWLARRIKPFDLIIYDLADAEQPDAFWPELRQAAGTTPVIVVTEPQDARRFSEMGFQQVVRGPMTLEQLVQSANLR